MPKGDEPKWLLKEGGGRISRTSLPKIGPPHSKVGPPKYSKIQTQQIVI